MSLSSRELEHWEREPFDEVSHAIEAMRRRCVGCPPARVVSAASADALPAEEQSAVTAHVAGCPACRELLSDFGQLEPAAVEPDLTDRILRQVRRPAAEGRSPSRRWLYWLPASVAAVLALAVYSQVARDRAPSPVATPPVAVAAAPPVTTAVAPSAAPKPTPGPALEKPQVKLTMLALTWRNGEETGSFAAAIAPALDAFRANRYEDADRLLAGLARDYPSSVEIPFYQGVSQLFLGQNAEAVATLRRARRLADSTFASDVSWYLGIALERAGHPTEAKARFARLCRGGSAYAARACEAAQ